MAAQRTFYIACNELVVYLCEGGRVDECARFFDTSSGLELFEKYLLKEADIISYILLDVIEEEYRHETIPHISRRDRQSMLQRKMGQAFRGTRWRDGLFQGREKDGKRHDKVMFSAITNPEVLDHWVEVIKKCRVPLEGIYSVAMMGRILLKQLKLKSSNTLLLTQQRGSLLRQTFLNDYDLKLSRLTNVPIFNDDEYSHSLSKEIDRQLRYLNRIGVLPYGQSIDIYVVTQEGMMDQFTMDQPGSSRINYHMLDMSRVALSIGFEDYLITGMCEPLYVHLLTLERPLMNYASSYDRRYFFMKRAKSWLIYTGVFFAAISLLWGINNTLNARSIYKNTVQNQVKTDQIMERYREQVETMPSLSLRPSDMRLAVEINAKLEKHNNHPERGLLAVSESLSAYRDIQLDEVFWQSDISQVDNEESQNIDEYDEVIPRVYQGIILKGHLSPFKGRYKEAFQRIDRFISTLNEHHDIESAKALAMPLDVDSSSFLKGEEKYRGKIIDPEFEILIYLKAQSYAN